MPETVRKREKRHRYHNELTKGKAQLPSKSLFRQRAHANPFSDHQLDYPISPQHMDWASHYPAYIDPDPTKINSAGLRNLTKDVEIVDIGCGYGGLLFALAPLMPETLMVGMEIRIQVTEFVISKIQALRSKHSAPSKKSSPETSCQNISALRANTMKFFPNFFTHRQLSKIFICFPDPHFKARKHKARIVSTTLNAEYAFALRPGGKVYTITDVEDLHLWMVSHFERSGVAGEAEEGEGINSNGGSGSGAGRVRELWERLSDEELAADDCVRVMRDETEEGKKVARNGGQKFIAVWRKKDDPEWPC